MMTHPVEPPPPGVPPDAPHPTELPRKTALSGPPPPAKNLITLIVKHVPTNVEPKTMQEVFKSVGAAMVRPCSAEGKLRGVVFVDFEDRGLAARAKDRLHGLKILNKTLAVDFARPWSAAPPSEPPTPKPLSYPPTSGAGAPDQKLPPGLIGGGQVEPQLGGFAGKPRPEGVAPGLKLNYPFPPHLRYRYPPPDASVLRNIQAALISVPRLYTQVLHLMNKMNLPPPFTSVFPPPPSQPIPAPPMVSGAPPSLQPAQHAVVSKGGVPGMLTSAPLDPPLSSDIRPVQEPPPGRAADNDADVSESDEGSEPESESEFESGDDREPRDRSSSRKRKKDRPAELKKRRRKGPKTGDLETAGVREVAIGAGSGVKEVRQRVKKTTMQIKLDVSSIKARTAKLPVPPVFKAPTAPPTLVPPTQEAPDTGQLTPVTREELKAGQVSQEEILVNPVFKNYKPGEATPVLYIKNIAKDVTVDDLLHVYGAFLNAEQRTAGAMRLMQEGRMKGQAFATFADVAHAEEAMSLTHGYLLKGKPLVVQFGRKQKAG